MKIEHRNFSPNNKSEGATIYSDTLGRGKLVPGQYITFFYEDGHIATGKVSRNGETVYISKKNFPFTVPTRGNISVLEVARVAILKTRAV